MRTRHITLTLLIPIIIILTNFSLLAFSQEYYEKQYTKNDVYSKIPKEQLESGTKNLISYLAYGEEIRWGDFNEKEKEHLKDVRRIIKYLTITLVLSTTLSFICLLSLLKNKKILGMSFIFGGLLTFALISILFLLLTNFDYSFMRFHEIMFANDLWVMNPETEKLVVMFPESFFYNITKDIAIRSLITAAFAIGLGSFFVLKNPLKN